LVKLRNIPVIAVMIKRPIRKLFKTLYDVIGFLEIKNKEYPKKTEEKATIKCKVKIKLKYCIKVLI
jgi:hypothetical protein